MPTKTLTPAARAHKAVKSKSISSLKKKAWAEFSKFIRARDNYTCYTCRRRLSYDGKGMHAGHFISRKVNATLFDEMNVHAQCLYCNMWNYGSTGPYAERLIEEYGIDAFKALLARGKESKQFTRPELEKLIKDFKEKVDSISKRS